MTRGGRVAMWAVLCTAVVGAVLFTALRATAPSDGARIAFYGEAWSSNGVAIAPIDPPAAGLQAGDRIQAVDGRTLDDWLSRTLAATARPAPGEPIAYRVDRGGQIVETSILWSPPGITGTLAKGWSVVIVSVALAAVAAFVYARRPREPAAVPLLLAAAAISGTSVPWFLGTTVSDVVQGTPFLFHWLLTGVLYMVAWPAALHLALVFPAPLPAIERRPWIVPSIYAAALGTYAIALVGTRLATTTITEWVATWAPIQVGLVVPLAIAAVAAFAWNGVRTRDPQARTRMRWVLAGGLTSGLTGLAIFWLPDLLGFGRLAPDEWIGMSTLPIPLGFAAAILRDRLFDIRVVVKRTLVYGGLTLGVVASYVVAAAALREVLGGGGGFGTSLLATGAAALVALPLRDVLQRTVNRLMYGDRDEPWLAMRRLGRQLEWAAEPDLAFSAIAATVAESLRLPYAALVLDEGTVVEHGVREGPTVDVPLAHGGAPVGRLALGVRAGEKGFRPSELALLEDLGRQAGPAIRAIRLRADLARSREQLVVAREEERRRLRRDLHDGLGPSLAAIGLRAEAAAATMETDTDAARHTLDELGADVRTALADIRRLVDGLRPPALDELGLTGAVEQQASRLQRNGREGAEGLTFTVDAVPTPLPDLGAAVEVAAYRIAVEAMTNAVRHADAATCAIRLDASDGSHLTVEVADDGRGLPVAPAPGVGLESIRARADELGGVVEIKPGLTGGTRVVARLPLARATP